MNTSVQRVVSIVLSEICASYLFAQIAQLVEQRTENPRVAGSIPALGIFLLPRLCEAFFVSVYRKETE